MFLWLALLFSISYLNWLSLTTTTLVSWTNYKKLGVFLVGFGIIMGLRTGNKCEKWKITFSTELFLVLELQ